MAKIASIMTKVPGFSEHCIKLIIYNFTLAVWCPNKNFQQRNLLLAGPLEEIIYPLSPTLISSHGSSSSPGLHCRAAWVPGKRLQKQCLTAMRGTPEPLVHSPHEEKERPREAVWELDLEPDKLISGGTLLCAWSDLKRVTTTSLGCFQTPPQLKLRFDVCIWEILEPERSKESVSTRTHIFWFLKWLKLLR